MAYAGLRALPVRLPESPFFHYFVVKRHNSEVPGGDRSADKEAAGDRTLFVSNLTSDFTDAVLNSIFEPCGEVEQIQISRLKNPAVGTFRVAHVVFCTEKGLECALGTKNLVMPNSFMDLSALERLVVDHKRRFPARAELKEEANRIVAEYEKVEEDEMRKKAALHASKDSDGFVLVSYKSKGGRKDQTSLGDGRSLTVGRAPSDFDSRTGLRKDAVLKDFYSFQKRDAKRKRLDELRMRFEADKERLARMKAGRRFRPY